MFELWLDVLENSIADNFDLLLFLGAKISNFEDNFSVNFSVGLLHHLFI